MKDEDLIDLVNKPKGKANPFAADKWDDPFAGDNPPGRLPTKTDALAQDILANPAPAQKPARTAPRAAKRVSDFDALQAEIAKYEASKAQEAKPAQQIDPGVHIDPKLGAVPNKRVYARFDDVPDQKFTAEQLAKIRPDTRMSGVTALAGGALQGATWNWGEELAALGQWARGQGEYSKLRDENRQALASARSMSPGNYALGEFTGGLLSPMNKLIPTGKTLTSLKSIAGSTGAGGLAALGSSEADLTKGEVGKAAIDTAEGAGLGTAAHFGLGYPASKLISGAPGRMGKSLLKDIVVNESGAAATPSAAKRLVQKEEGVISELKADPKLAKATRGSAKGAIAKINEKMDEISKPRAGYYEQMDKLAPLDLGEINAGLNKAINGASNAAEKRVAEAALEDFNDFFLPKWKREGSLISRPGQPAAVNGQAARKWVTESQQPAARVLGSFQETEHAKLKNYMADAVVDTWQNHLDQVGQLDPKLVANIREYDKRASSLLAMREALQQRSEKESRGFMSTVKQHQKSLTGGLLASSAALAFEHPHASASMIGALAAAHAAPVAGRAINDRMLVPLADAIAAGNSKAQIIKMAAEIGVPQSTARTMFDIYQSKQKKGKR